MRYNFQIEDNPRSEHFETVTIFIEGVKAPQEKKISKLVGRPIDDFDKSFPKAVDSAKGRDLRLAVVSRCKNDSLRLWFAHSREDQCDIDDLLNL